MPIPNDLALVAGDVIAVSAIVKYDVSGGRGDAYACVGDAYGTPTRISRADATIVSTVLAKGDEVRAKEAAELTDHGFAAPQKAWPYGIVVAIHDDTAWVDWPIGPSLEPVAMLRRVRTRAQVEDCDPRPGEAVVPAVEATAFPDAEVVAEPEAYPVPAQEA